MIATAALALALVCIHGAPVYGRAAHSARSFHHYFQDLKSADASLNPFERVFFSLILANTDQKPQR
jgi:hypothetical protein